MTQCAQHTHLRSLLNDYLEKVINQDKTTPPVLNKAARYALLSPGKRLRPLILLSALVDLGINVNEGLDVACALEMIHTYSLIHDDLPCMDDDDLRRGKPSLHIEFGESTAILTGDYLLTKALEIIFKSNCPREIGCIITHQSGGSGMIGGQLLDLSLEKNSASWNKIYRMYQGKTSALISAAFECAAVLALRPPFEQNLMKNCGEYFGIAFQINDDILDFLSTTKKLGKPARSDIKNNKVNLVTYLGIEKSQHTAEEYTKKGFDTLPKEYVILGNLMKSIRI